MDLKKPLEFNEQINRLRDHGMIINCEEKALNILRKINYYRFTGYALQFRVNPQDSNYVEGTTFESVHNLYIVDEHLRDLFRMYIEKAEVYYRTQIAYGFSINKCLDAPHDQHYDESNFYHKEGIIR